MSSNPYFQPSNSWSSFPPVKHANTTVLTFYLGLPSGLIDRHGKIQPSSPEHSGLSKWCDVTHGWSTISDYFTINKTGGLYSLIKSIFSWQRGEAMLSRRQTVVQQQLGWGLHTSHVLFLSSAALHFPVRGKPNNTWINACWICWSGAALGM